MTDDIRKLLGGYATGTLTEEERKALYEAALEDQALFEALADEQALKELLEDSTARAALLEAASETPRFSAAALLREWWERPRSKALVAVGAVLFLSIGIREVMQRTAAEHRSDTVAVMMDVPSPARAEPPAERTPLPPAAAAPRTDARSAAAPARKKANTEVDLPRQAQAAVGEEVEERKSVALADNSVMKAQSAAPKEEVQVSAAAPALPARVALGGASAEKTVAAADVQLTYTLLLRNQAGEYLPVQQDYVFAAGDHARIRVSTNRRGVLAATGPDGKPMFGGSVAPGSPVTLPVDITFEQAAAPQVDLEFSPLPDTGVGLGFAAEDAPRAARTESTLRAKQASAPAPAASVSVRVTFRKK